MIIIFIKPVYISQFLSKLVDNVKGNTMSDLLVAFCFSFLIHYDKYFEFWIIWCYVHN